MFFLPKKYKEFLPLTEVLLDRVFRSQDIPQPLPQLIVPVGHRGTMTYAPENTVAAHEKAYEMGARCMEFDVRCTKDGHFVVFHDRGVERTTDGRGDVEDLTLAEIQKLDAGSHKSDKFEGEAVPTLRDALRNVRGRYAVDVDFKGGPKHSAAMLDEILEDEGFTRDGAPLVTIFARHNDFALLRSLAPKHALRPHYLGRRHAQRMAKDHKLEIMGLRRYVFSFAAARNIRTHGLHLFSNTMGENEWENFEISYDTAAKAGSLFIQTDFIDRLVEYLGSIGKLETRVLGRDYLPIEKSKAVSA